MEPTLAPLNAFAGSGPLENSELGEIPAGDAGAPGLRQQAHPAYRISAQNETDASNSRILQQSVHELNEMRPVSPSHFNPLSVITQNGQGKSRRPGALVPKQDLHSRGA